MFEWLMNPTIWLGLITLVILEIVLGIDNLIFVAILANKLPPSQRDKARVIGLGLALFFRIALLSSISWLATLTKPVIEIFGEGFSGRDLILLAGGLFLLFKATMELHERLEGQIKEQNESKKVQVGFWSIIIQIIAIDVVFSLDSVITAVGMVDDLTVMILAVVIAVIVMMVASKPLSTFINQRPTLIVLCLGFLLMIGLSLVAEGFDFHIPKGYLYAAIGFSVLVEMFNQISRAKRKKQLANRQSLRLRTSQAVLRLLGEKTDVDSEEVAAIASSEIRSLTFSPEERNMISGVLGLAELSAKSIMTHRKNLHTVFLDDDIEVIREKMRQSPFSRLIVVKDKMLHEAVGYIRRRDLPEAIQSHDELPVLSILQQPLFVQEDTSVLDILGQIKKTGVQIAFVRNTKDHLIGIITLTDIMEAITGDMGSTQDQGQNYESFEPTYAPTQ